MNESFEFIKKKRVYTSWSDDELFISVERKSEAGDGEYDEITATIQFRDKNQHRKDRYIISPIPFILGHEEGDNVVLSVESEAEGRYTTIAVTKLQCDKLADMVDAVNAEFERV